MKLFINAKSTNKIVFLLLLLLTGLIWFFSQNSTNSAEDTMLITLISSIKFLLIFLFFMGIFWEHFLWIVMGITFTIGVGSFLIFLS